MEPRFFNHGDMATHGVIDDVIHYVSMEPRFFNHGDVDSACIVL